jgi:hypothetical protein
MDRILELVRDVSEVSAEKAYGMIDHACRVDKLNLEVSRKRWGMAGEHYVTRPDHLNTARYPRDIGVYCTIDLSIPERSNTDPRGLFHTFRDDLPSY